MTMKRFGFSVFSDYSRVLWLAVATITIVSEIVPNPQLRAVLFYGLYSPAKLLCFLALGFLTPLAFARHRELNRGIAFAAVSAALIEGLQGLVGNGHSFHWYELVAKLIVILFGFVLGLDARYERDLSIGVFQVSPLAGFESKHPV